LDFPDAIQIVDLFIAPLAHRRTAHRCESTLLTLSELPIACALPNLASQNPFVGVSVIETVCKTSSTGASNSTAISGLAAPVHRAEADRARAPLAERYLAVAGAAAGRGSLLPDFLFDFSFSPKRAMTRPAINPA